MKLCDAFFMTCRQFYIDSWLQNFGFSEHPRKLPRGLRRVITESAVPIGKTARSQYVDFHTLCESPHKNGLPYSIRVLLAPGVVILPI